MLYVRNTNTRRTAMHFNIKFNSYILENNNDGIERQFCNELQWIPIKASDRHGNRALHEVNLCIILVKIY